MTKRMAIVSIGAVALAALLIATVVYRHRASRPESSAQFDARSAFSAQLDLDPLGMLSVYEDGRLKSFDSYASSMMFYVSGAHDIGGDRDGFNYLDLMLDPDAYRDADVVYVKSKPMRGDIVQALRRSLE